MQITADQPVVANKLRETVDALRAMSVRALARMYLPKERLYCHCIRRGPRGDVAEGVSRRYTAIVLIGLAGEDRETVASATDGTSATALGDRLLADVDSVTNLGDVALTLWAAAILNHPQASRALDRLRVLDPARGPHPTVEVAWALTALSADSEVVGDAPLAGRIAGRLIRSFERDSEVFRHWADGAPAPFLRGHVSCFADMVYPVQALSYHHRCTGDAAALQVARRGGVHMVEAQGPDGQWWWHFDARSGRVVEPFPVYSVHQDSMAPMALLALQDASGVDASAAIARGLRWLIASPEIGGRSLIDREADLIWRKVSRHEPGKFARGLQALASRMHPSLRVPGVNGLLRPGFIDHECRPYHPGWILHAFNPTRLDTWTFPACRDGGSS